MAKLQLGRFPMSKNGYLVAQFRITMLWCSIGCVQMAKLQGRFPISKIAYAVLLDVVLFIPEMAKLQLGRFPIS